MKSYNELISIIVPIYNAEKYLKECIESIQNSLYSNLEIILVNDGSTDNSKSIIHEYSKKDKRIIVINQENSGPSAARNTGLKYATGQYIAFVDSDDFVDKEIYLELYNQIKLSKSDIATIGMKRVYLNHKTTLFYKFDEKKVFTQKEALEEFFDNNIITFSLCDKLFSKEIINGIRLDENIKMCEDQKFVFDCIMNCNSIVSIPKYLYNIRMSDNSLSRSIPQKYHLSMLDVNEYIISKIKDNTIALEKANIYNANICLTYFIPAINSGIYDKCEIKKFYEIVDNNKKLIMKKANNKTKCKLLLFCLSPNLLYFAKKIIKNCNVRDS